MQVSFFLLLPGLTRDASPLLGMMEHLVMGTVIWVAPF